MHFLFPITITLKTVSGKKTISKKIGTTKLKISQASALQHLLFQFVVTTEGRIDASGQLPLNLSLSDSRILTVTVACKKKILLYRHSTKKTPIYVWWERMNPASWYEHHKSCDLVLRYGGRGLGYSSICSGGIDESESKTIVWSRGHW